MSTINIQSDGVYFEEGTSIQPHADLVFTAEKALAAPSSLVKRNPVIAEKDVDSIDQEDERDVRKKQVFKGRYLFW